MSDPRPVVVSLQGVSRYFGPPEQRTVALSSVDLTVCAGEFVAIVGPSGAGKSTLLNILGLLDEPSEGGYTLAGVDVSAAGERERNRLRNEQIGFVFQSSHMLLDETAASNAAMPLKVRGADVRDRTSKVRGALERLGLSHRVDERAVNLSGGERQRVAIARAIASEPAVLLADEPTGALDTKNSALIIEHLRSLNAQGVTIIVITHDPTVAAAAGRQVRIVDGVLSDDNSIAAGPKTESVVGATPVAPGRRVTKLVDEMLDALASQTGRPARSLLLLTAFVLGAGGLVCAAGISQSASAQVAERLTAASLDEVNVRSASPTAWADGFYTDGRDGAAAAIESLDGVRAAGFVGSVPAAEAQLSALPDTVPQTVAANGVTVADGSYLKLVGALVEPANAAELLDNDWSGRVAIVGQDAADRLGVATPGPGSTVWVHGIPVDVVGILADGGRHDSLSDTVVISAAAASAADLTPDDVALVVRTEAGFPAAVADAAPVAVAPADPASVRVSTVADLRNLRVGVATDLGSLVGVVSALLLALASLSSAVAMYLSVQTRASEIALRRAVGASRSSIWRMFTLEGLIIGLAGGIAGGALGLGAVIAVCAVQGWTPTLDLSLLGVGLAAGGASGVVSATYPAIAAARANPALAIRG